MTIFNLKYPTYNSEKEIVISSMVIGVLVYLFLALFQPFGTYNYIHSNKYLLLVPYAIISFVSFFIGDYTTSKYFTSWNWKNEVVKTFVLLLFCAVVNYFYNIYFINNANFSIRTLCYMILFTYTLGIPVCAIAVLGKYSFLRNKYVENQTIETEKENNKVAASTLSIIPDVGDTLKISKDAFLYAKSEGNYSSIFYVQNQIVEKQLLRISLKHLEEQIGAEIIFRCHRSYIINSQNAVYKKGNAQGFKISMKFTDEEIPVSRKYIYKISNIPL